MSMFGKKDGNDQTGDDIDGVEDIEIAPEGEAPSAELAAPARTSARSGGKKGFLILLLLLAGGVPSAGYFYLNGTEMVDGEIPVASTPAPEMAAAEPVPSVPTSDPLAAPVTSPMDAQFAGDAAPPLDPLADPAAVVPPADPLADPLAPPPADMAAMPPVDTLADDLLAPPPVPALEGVTGNTNTDVLDPATALGEFSVPAAPPQPGAVQNEPVLAEVSAVLGEPPSDPAAVALPADPLASLEEKPADTSADMELDDAPSVPAAEELMGMPDMPPGASPSPQQMASGQEPAPSVSGPTEAETAIVQNAEMLDQLSQPTQTSGNLSGNVDATVQAMTEVMTQDALIRPLPKQYLVVKKDSSADTMDSRLIAARSALARDRNTAALEMFTELHNENPRDKRVLMGKAVSLQKLGQGDKALSAYEEVLSQDPKNIPALTNMLGLLRKHDPALAVSKLNDLHDIYPANPEITAQLGISYGAMGEYEKAIRFLDIAESLKPGSAYVLYNKAVVYDRMGSRIEAGQLYRQVVRLAAEGDLDQSLPIDAIKRRLTVLH